LDLDIITAVIRDHLDDLADFARMLVARSPERSDS